LISLVLDNCQLFHTVISTYNLLVFDQFECAFNNMNFR
jgi:serine/threonine-protein kinase RIO1